MCAIDVQQSKDDAKATDQVGVDEAQRDVVDHIEEVASRRPFLMRKVERRRIMAPASPAGEATVRLPGWAVGSARAGSILAMFFGLVSLMLMISGAPKYPVYWPTVWATIGLVLFAGCIFVGTTAQPIAAGPAVADHPIADAHATGLGDRAAADMATGDEEIYTSNTPVVDTAKRVTATPGNDLADGAPTTQRRALAASAIERQVGANGNGNGNGARTGSAANGANRANNASETRDTMGRRPVRPRP